MTSDKSRSVEECAITSTLSAIEDKSSVLYEGRAEISHLEDIVRMQGTEWRARLEDAIEKSGRSKREISLAAGKGPGYVFSILSEGKDPTIDNLIAICGAINVSLTQILYGVQMSPETQEILSLIESNPNMRSGILQILREKDKV